MILRIIVICTCPSKPGYFITSDRTRVHLLFQVPSTTLLYLGMNVLLGSWIHYCFWGIIAGTERKMFGLYVDWCGDGLCRPSACPPYAVGISIGGTVKRRRKECKKNKIAQYDIVNAESLRLGANVP